VPKVPKKELQCHPFGKLRTSSEAKPKELANELEILPLRLRSGLKAFFAQNDSFAVTLGTLTHFRHFNSSAEFWFRKI